MKNSVIYTRYSSSSQDEQTIEVQLKACREYAEKNGYNVIEEYIDEAKSGRTDKRPAFQKMIKDSENKQFKYVIVYKLDRFARNLYLSVISEKELTSKGIITLSTCEPYSDDANGKLMRQMNYILAEYYSNDYAQRIKKGLENSASKYLSTGGQISLGYKVVDKKFTIDETKAFIVKKIFEMYAEGDTMFEIIRYLNSQGLKTAKNSAFNKNSIHRILVNKRYIGIYTFKDSEAPNKIPRIISDELFNKVQDMMKKNKKAPARARAKAEYLLTTKLFCGKCKEMMTGMSGTSRNGNLHNYYACKNVRIKFCDKKNIQKEYIEDLVVEEARKILTDENVSKIANDVVMLYEQTKENFNLNRLSRALKDNKKKKDNLIMAVAETDNDSIRRSLFDKISEFEKENSILEKELAIEQSKQIKLTVPQIKFFLKSLRKGDVNDIRYRRTLINTLINKVYVYDDKLIIIINTQEKAIEVDIEDIECSLMGSVAPPYANNR